MTQISNCIPSKRVLITKDFKIDYTDPKKKASLEISCPGNNFLKAFEIRAEQELLEEEITVSKVIQFTNKLEEVGMHICLAEEIRRIKTSEKPKLIALYREAFTEFDLNPVMTKWVDEFRRIGLFHYNELIAAASLKRFEIDKQTCYQVLLIGVWKQHKRKKNGSKLMNYIMDPCNRIVLWSDYKIVSFFKKLGFKKNKEVEQLTKDHVIYEPNSIFLCCGFDLESDEESEDLFWDYEAKEKLKKMNN